MATSNRHAVRSALLVSLALMLLVSAGCGPAIQGSTLSESEAQDAVASMRVASVDGQLSSSGWLHVESDGSFSATGYLTDSAGGSTASGGPFYLSGLQVPEKVGSLTVYHVIPLSITDATQVTYEGKRVKYSELDPIDGSSADRNGYWLDARFSVHGNTINADSLVFTTRELTWSGWPDDLPPVPLLDQRRLQSDADLPAAPGERWLDVVTSTGTVDPYPLKGHSGSGMTASDVASGEPVASTDVTVPDRLGPAAVYHLVWVFYDDAADMPAQTSPDMLHTYPVALRQARLMWVGR